MLRARCLLAKASSARAKKGAESVYLSPLVFYFPFLVSCVLLPRVSPREQGRVAFGCCG